MKTFTENNLNELKILLSDFHETTGIRIGLFDGERKAVIRYPEETPAFCALIQSVKEHRSLCGECDKAAMEKAGKMGSFYLYRCHAGLAECVMPLSDGKNVVGYLILGHMFTGGEYPDERESILRTCAGYGISEEEASAALSALRVVSAKQIGSAARLLRCLAAYVLSNHLFTYDRDDAASLAEEYIRAHYRENVTPDLLSHMLGVGKTNLYAAFRKKYGMGIAEYVRDVRLSRAAELLRENNRMSVAEVGYECGFGDYNYFITVFRRHFGLSPKKYASRAAR